MTIACVLGFIVALCVVAIVCGAFVSMDGFENWNKSILGGAVVVGGVMMGFEMLKSAIGLKSLYFRKVAQHFSNHSNVTRSPSSSIDSIHPWEGASSRVLRIVTNNVISLCSSLCH